MAEPENNQTSGPSSPSPSAVATDQPPELQSDPSPPLTSPSQQPTPTPTPPRPPPRAFDPSRMIGIIKRKALIKELAAVYHAECLAYCQELLELQKNYVEPFVELKAPEDSRKQTLRPKSKRNKKSR